MPIGAIVATGISIGKGLIDAGIFGKEPTPEEQKEKAGVWYNMLQDWALNQPYDSNQFADKWKNFLPFKQKSTKDRFLSEHIRNKSYDSIVDHLVQKINDELIKGGFPQMSKETILAGMGAGSSVSDSSTSNTAVSGNLPAPLRTQDFETVDDVNEGRTFFYIMALIAVGALSLWYFLTPKKRKRR